MDLLDIVIFIQKNSYTISLIVIGIRGFMIYLLPPPPDDLPPPPPLPPPNEEEGRVLLELGV